MLLCVLAFSLAGCNGEIQQTRVNTGGDEQEQTQEVTPPQEDTGAEESTEEQEETDEGVTYEEFKSALQDNPEYHVEYGLTLTNDQKKNVVIYTKDNKTRMEIEHDEEAVTAWMNGESVVEYEGQCVDIDTASQFGFDPESIYDMTTVEGSIKTDEKNIDVSSAGTKNIADKTTNCYEIAYETDSVNELTTYCLTDKGIPALLKTVSKDTGELKGEARAKTLDDSVSDSVLEPCEPDMDVSGMI
ncbi:MAG: hypothetical protein ACOCQG_06260 [Candidatus Nanoarchaeia archaeon]